MAHLVRLKEIEYGIYGDLIMVLGDSRMYDTRGAMVCCLGFRDSTLGFQVWGLGLWGFNPKHESPAPMLSSQTSILLILNS